MVFGAEQALEDALVHRMAQRRVVAPHAPVHLVPRGRRGHQRIERNLVDAEPAQHVEVVLEHRERLSRQVEDHVDVERREHALHGRQALPDHLAAAVLLQSFHAREQPVVEALHADGKPRDARVTVAAQRFAIQVVRIGLDRHRAHGREPAQQVQRRDQFVRIDGRRAAADIDVGEAETGVVVQLDLAPQRVEVPVRLRLVVADAVERAERAQHFAERHVHVELARKLRRGGHDLGAVVFGEAHRRLVFVAQDGEQWTFEPEHEGGKSRRFGRRSRRPDRSSDRRRWPGVVRAGVRGSRAHRAKPRPLRPAADSGTRRR